MKEWFYDKNLNADEVNDLQYMLEENYWLFGEQYSAVAKAENSFVSLVKNHFDTYDYIDKLLGFRLGDVFYATFYKYGENSSSELSFKMSNYIKYGTNNEKEIWILRYGFDFEDMDWLYNNIELIDEHGIKLVNNANLTEEQYNKVRHFII